MNDEQYFLASAYADGELTDDERRIAEADPAVMAEVETMRDVRAQLRSVPDPDPDVRETAISAAMVEFGRRNAAPAASVVAAASSRPARPVPIRPRPQFARVLGIAAAVVAVGLVGVVVTQGIGGGDDDAASDAGDAEIAVLDAEDGRLNAELPAEGSDDAALAADAAPAAGAEDSMDEAADEPVADSAEATADVAEETAQDDMSADRSVAGDDTVATDADTADGGTDFVDVDVAYQRADNGEFERPDIDVESPITDDLELGAFGTYLLERREAGELPPTPNTPCPPSFNILDSARAVINRIERDVYIAVQEDDGLVLAIDPDTCVALVDGPLFPPNLG